MHNKMGIGVLVESVALTREKADAMGIPNFNRVGWWGGFKITDEATWQKIKGGELRAFSIGGRGRREPIDAPTA
jgi:hypothetical protein